jgi:16S rRNA (uracil1498-N3)-methyltransferase
MSPLVVFNGRGGEYTAKISYIAKHEVKIIIENYSDIDRESQLHLHLGQAISHNEKMRYTLQKAVELGVSEITPLYTAFSEKNVEKKQKHWRAIIISAAEQSGRTRIPKLHSPVSLATWLTLSRNSLNIVADPRASKTINTLPSLVNSVTVLSGAEGGFHEDEITLAKQNHFEAIQMGPRILRTETAAVASLAILQEKYGDFNL